MNTVLETGQLILRPFTLEDFDAFAAMYADPGVTEFVTEDGRPLSRFAAWRAFAGIVGHWTLRGFGLFAVVERTTGTFVGRIGPWDPEGWPDFEIGWTLRSEYWGRGYATEAVKRCIEHAFTELDRSHISTSELLIEYLFINCPWRKRLFCTVTTVLSCHRPRRARRPTCNPANSKEGKSLSRKKPRIGPTR